MATAATSDLDCFIEFCRTLADREHMTAEEALQLYRLQAGGTDEPRTELVRNLRRLRKEYLEAGGRLLTPEEIEQEVRERRGERYSEE